MAVQGRFEKNREEKYLDGSGENDKGKKLRKKIKRYKLRREETDVTELCETAAVIKGFQYRYISQQYICVNTWAHNY